MVPSESELPSCLSFYLPRTSRQHPAARSPPESTEDHAGITSFSWVQPLQPHILAVVVVFFLFFLLSSPVPSCLPSFSSFFLSLFFFLSIFLFLKVFSLKDRVTEGAEKPENFHLLVHPQQGQAEARSFVWVSRVGAGAHVLEPSAVAFPSPFTWCRGECGSSGLKQHITGSGLMCCALPSSNVVCVGFCDTFSTVLPPAL